jgi:hypothetical protein
MNSNISPDSHFAFTDLDQKRTTLPSPSQFDDTFFFRPSPEISISLTKPFSPSSQKLANLFRETKPTILSADKQQISDIDTEIERTFETSTSVPEQFVRRTSPPITIPPRSCSSPLKLAYSLGPDSPSFMGDDLKLNPECPSFMEVALIRRVLKDCNTTMPTLTQMLLKKSLNSEFHIYHGYAEDIDADENAANQSIIDACFSFN